MSKICSITGAKPSQGSIIHRRGLAKKKGGIFGIGGQKQNRPIWSGPLLAGERLLMVGETGELVAMNAKTGEIMKRVDIKGASTLAPIAMGDTVYVVTQDADLVAIR